MKKKAPLLIALSLISIIAFSANAPRRIVLSTTYTSVDIAIDDIAKNRLPEAGIFPESVDKEYGRIKTEPVELQKLNGTGIYNIRVYSSQGGVVMVELSGTWIISGYNEKTPSSFEKKERAQKGSIAAKTWNSIEQIAGIIPFVEKTYR